MLMGETVIPPDVNIQKSLTSLHIDEWIREDAFRSKWWLLLFLILAAFVIWWKLTDKARVGEIWLYAALAAAVCMGMHEYGEELTLWDYPVDIIPIFPPLSSINLIYLPLVYSIVYQHFKSLKSFIAAVLIVTGAFCFIMEPLFSLIGFYQLIKWNYFYSFLLYAAMAVFVRAVVVKIGVATQKEGGPCC